MSIIHIMSTITIPANSILYHGTTWDVKRGDFFTSFDPSVETFVTSSEKAAEFFAGDPEEPSGDAVVLRIRAKRDIILSTTPGDKNADGFTRQGIVAGEKYDDTLIFNPNDVLLIEGYKMKKKNAKWSKYQPLPCRT
jgi:hypothetical protein